ncbi:hypothetical protein PCAR4_570182 [Paraburkholderia caribensis]|nr:hypothetical protein PCAR4_570182 [Paraburkholderia caribensis]
MRGDNQHAGQDDCRRAHKAFRECVAFNNVEVNARYQISRSLFAGGAYAYLRQGKVASSDGAIYHTVSGPFGLDYFLSKRTDVNVLGGDAARRG